MVEHLPHRQTESEVYQRLPTLFGECRGWNGLSAVLTSTPLNICGISLDMLFARVTNTTILADLQQMLVEK